MRSGSSPALSGKAAQDEEDTGAGERPAVRVQEQLLPVAAVEVRPTAREVAAEGFRCLPPDRHDPFLAALAEAADESVLEIDGLPVERDRLADAQPGAVEELTEGAVAEVARRRPGGGIEQPLDLRGRERARQRPAAFRELDVRRGVVGARAEQNLVPEEGADGGKPARDGRRREAVRAELRDVGREVVAARVRGRAAEPRGQVGEVAAIGLDGARGEPSRGEGEEALDGGIRLFLLGHAR